MYAMFNDVGQVVTTRYPACYSFNSKVVAWLLQPPFTTLLLGCHKVATTRYPACYSFNSKVVSNRRESTTPGTRKTGKLFFFLSSFFFLLSSDNLAQRCLNLSR